MAERCKTERFKTKGSVQAGYSVNRRDLTGIIILFADTLLCLYELIDTPYIKTDLPAITELTLRSCDTGFILHMLNYVVTRKAKIMDTIEEKFTVCDRKIWVKTGKCPKRILKIPQKTEIPFLVNPP